MRNFIDEIEEEMYKGEDFVTLRLNKFYEFLASMEAWDNTVVKQTKEIKMSDLTDKRVFDSIEEINQEFSVDLTVPTDLPRGCNLLCYDVKGLYDVELFHPYKLDNNLHHWDKYANSWIFSNENLDQELLDDKFTGRHNYIYLHLTTKDKFTPERLLGVLTDHGHIQDVGIRYITTTGYHYCTLEDLKFYISDDSDETVSFDEYIKLFYDVEGVL